MLYLIEEMVHRGFMAGIITKIKSLIHGILPSRMYTWLVVVQSKLSKFRNKSTKEVFTEIYNTNYWCSSESISGAGSELIQTTSLRESLDSLLSDLDIKSILDIPCGDFNWMRHLRLQNKNYIGADIVEQVIKRNKEKYQQKNIKFEVLNLICSSLPQSDIVITRDCFVHLSYDNIYNSIKNLKSSKSKYLLTTTYSECKMNCDITAGQWRKLNFQIKPFLFPKPILIINENCTEHYGKHRDKSMALWEISKIPVSNI